MKYIVLLLIHFLPAQNEKGLALVQNFTSKDYKASPQNWGAVQDQNGIMYFANTKGILQYDGENWRLIRSKRKAIVRCLAVDKRNRIYYGSSSEFGYLALDSLGAFYCKPLQDRLPKDIAHFSDVWKIHILNDAVFFFTRYKLFILRGETFEIQNINPLSLPLISEGKYIYGEKGKGLVYYENATFKKLANGAFFKDKMLSFMLPFQKGKTLVASRGNGLFIYDGKSFKSFKTQIDQDLKESVLSEGSKFLGQGKYLIISRKAGATFLNSTGEELMSLRKGKGLLGQTIYDAFLDRDNAIWLMMDNGISRVEEIEKAQYFAESSAVSGTVEDIVHFQSRLFIASRTGVYSYNEKKQLFEQIKTIKGQAISFLAQKNALLVATSRALYQIKGRKSEEIKKAYSYKVVQSLRDPSRIYLCQSQKFSSLYFDRSWNTESEFNLDNFEISDALEDGNFLWLLSKYNGLLRFSIQADGKLNPNYKLIASEFLTTLSENRFLKFQSKLYLRSGKDYFQLADGEISRAEHFPVKLRAFEIQQIKKSAEGSYSIFGFKNNRPELFITSPKTQWRRFTDQRYVNQNLRAIYPYKNNLYIANSDGLYRINLKAEEKERKKYQCLIRKVSIAQDSLLFWGDQQKHSKPYELAYRENEIKIDYAVNRFDLSNDKIYQFRLLGKSDEWSNWTEESTKTFSNLWEGDYHFQVRAKDAEIGEFSFHITTPFYRSIWAYLLYIVFAVLFVMFLISWRNLKLKKEKEELEALVKERTKEINERNALLKQQSIDLEALNQMRSHFFANISHEFRTPLTLILSPIESLLKEKKLASYFPNFWGIRRSGKRLLQLVNQLLDLSALEGQKLRLYLSYSSLNRFSKRVLENFSSLAESRKITLEFNEETALDHCYFDKDIIEKVLTNLLSNAFKYTDVNGRISLSIEKKDAAILIKVKDSGSGIEASEIQHIFDRFYQATNKQSFEMRGSGIGLSLCKELMERHAGEISLSSHVGKGTEFQLKFPLGLAQYYDYEILEEERETSDEKIDLELLEGTAAKIKNNTIKEKEGSQQKLLLIDDSFEIRTYIKEKLESRYFIIEAVDGEDGTNKAFSFLPDLIVSDVMMPKLDGFHFVERMKSDFRTSHIPIILLTARASDEQKIAGLKYGADDYIIKPFNMDELQVRIENLLEIRKNLREHFSSKNFGITDDILESGDEIFLKKLIGIIDENLSDANFNVNLLCEEIGMSQSTLYTKIKYLSNFSTSQFIRSIRIKRSAELLEKKKRTISEAAYEVGFNNLSYFSKCFKEFTGHLPSDYLKK